MTLSSLERTKQFSTLLSNSDVSSDVYKDLFNPKVFLDLWTNIDYQDDDDEQVVTFTITPYVPHVNILKDVKNGIAECIIHHSESIWECILQMVRDTDGYLSVRDLLNADTFKSAFRKTCFELYKTGYYSYIGLGIKIENHDQGKFSLTLNLIDTVLYDTPYIATIHNRNHHLL